MINILLIKKKPLKINNKTFHLNGEPEIKIVFQNEEGEYYDPIKLREMKKISNTIDTVFSPDFQHFSNIQHWNGTPRNSPITLPHHSWWVSVLANLLCVELEMSEKFRLECVNYALFHDLDEMFTGDVMHPFKYNTVNGVKIRDLIEKYVETAVQEIFSKHTDVGRCLLAVSMENPTAEIKCIVKLADNLSLLNYCLTEVMSGNKFFEQHKEKCLELIKKSCNTMLALLPSKKPYILDIISQIENKMQ